MKLAWVFAVGALVLMKAAPITFVDPDLFHQLSLAREIVEGGAVPRVDTFAYTPTLRPLVHHEWGAGMLWFGVISLGGLTALMIAKYLVLGGLGLICWLSARRRGSDGLTFLLCALPAVLLSANAFTSIRAHLLTMVALAALLGVLGTKPRRTWPLVAWLGAHLLWLNVHAGFIVGLGFMGLTLLERGLRREPLLPLAGATVGASALVLFNPWGSDYVSYLAHGLTMARSEVVEWTPLYADLGALWMYFALWLLMASLTVYALYARGWRACRGLAPVLVTLVVSLQHQRHVALLAVTWLVVAAPWLTKTPLARHVRSFFATRARVLWLVGAAAGLMWTGLALLYEPFELRLPTDTGARMEGQPTFPVGATDYLVEHRFDGRVMTPFVEGAYAMWRLHPQGARISFDGRFEAAYPPDVQLAHRVFYAAGGGWADVLRAYPTDVILVPRDQPILTPLLSSPGWRVVYGDDLYVLVAREGIALPFTDRRGRTFVGRLP